MADIRIPPDMKIGARFDSDLLQGVIALQGTVIFRSSGEWKESFYRELERTQTAPVSASFIPLLNLGESWTIRNDRLATT